MSSGIARAARTYEIEQNMLRFNNRAGDEIRVRARGTKHWKSKRKQLRAWLER